MILDKIVDAYKNKPERPSTGNVTASRFGTCTAQLQGLITKTWKPAPFRPRALMVFEHGDLIENWFSNAIEMALPGMHGLRGEVFYTSVPLDAADTVKLVALIKARKRWGRVMNGFQRPSVSIIESSGQRRARFSNLLPRKDPKDKNSGPAMWGFVVDEDARMLYAPGFIDRMVWHPELETPVLVEKKSASNWAFRRMLIGEVDYQKRCQLVGMAEATGLDCTWLVCRKETMHLLEMSYTNKVASTEVRIRSTSGDVTKYFGMHSKYADKLKTIDGEVVRVPGDTMWDTASVWTPWESDALIEEIRERVRRVMLADADPGGFLRQYGPSFTCGDCEGLGKVRCPWCDGTRVSKRSKKGAACNPCAASKEDPSTIQCKKCDGVGFLDEAELPGFPCGYCPVVEPCYGSVYTLKLEEKPHYVVSKVDWDASGLSFTSPACDAR